MNDDLDDVGLENLMGGLAIERFNDEFSRVLANIVDPNTPATAKREITLKVVIKPDKSRDLGNVEIAVSSRLAAAEKVATRVFIALTKSGPVATEHNPRQPSLPEVLVSNNASVTPLRAANGGAA